MSQHLINDFIHRPYLFKPLDGGKIVTNKLVKYKASDRKNNNSPEDIEETVHTLKSIKAKNTVDSSDKEHDDKHIDITI